MQKTLLSLMLISALAIPGMSEELETDNIPANPDKEVKDMSDVMSVYTQAGIGSTSKGINIKIGRTYDTGNPQTVAMNLIEVKGIGGDELAWGNSDGITTNSVDSIRIRNYSVDLTTQIGSQIDFKYDLNSDYGILSYSVLASIPKIWRFKLYPLVGVGAAVANNLNEVDPQSSSGFTIPGVLGAVGLYAKFTITDKVWLNYNPNWSFALAGSDWFMDHGLGGHDNLYAHELVASYQINPRLNIRCYNDWSSKENFSDGIHKIEFNYQF